MINNIVRHIPNALTSLNLLIGCVGIILVFKSGPEYAAYCIWLAAVFDFLDGFSARMLKAYSDMGKELDSLADVVSFGVLPGIILYSVFLYLSPSEILPFIGLIIPVFAALRLAKFNIDDSQSENFKGLPTPATALAISSVPLIIHADLFEQGPFLTTLLVAYTIFLAFMMVVPVTLISLKFKDFKWYNNKNRFIFVICSIGLIAWWGMFAFPLIIVLYILISLFSRKER